MARGVISCHGCKQRIEWFDDAWRLKMDGSAVCAAAPVTDDRRRHTIEVSR